MSASTPVRARIAKMPAGEQALVKELRRAYRELQELDTRFKTMKDEWEKERPVLSGVIGEISDSLVKLGHDPAEFVVDYPEVTP